MDKEKIFLDLVAKYKQQLKKSEALFENACQHQIRGYSHNLRFFPLFPFYDVHCSGSQVTDVDGNTYIDFWQG